MAKTWLNTSFCFNAYIYVICTLHKIFLHMYNLIVSNIWTQFVSRKLIQLPGWVAHFEGLGASYTIAASVGPQPSPLMRPCTQLGRTGLLKKFTTWNFPSSHKKYGCEKRGLLLERFPEIAAMFFFSGSVSTYKSWVSNYFNRGFLKANNKGRL